MQRPLAFAAILVSTMLASGCARKEPSPVAKAPIDCELPSDHGKVGPGTALLLSTLSKMNLINPFADLDANLSNGDRRFIAINSYACAEPGVGDGDRQFLIRYPSRCLAGTGDVIEGHLDWALRDAAPSYAMTYNTELLRRLHFGSIP
jgi:hypothetical protein